jgi:hypothetical protein
VRHSRRVPKAVQLRRAAGVHLQFGSLHQPHLAEAAEQGHVVRAGATPKPGRIQLIGHTLLLAATFPRYGDVTAAAESAASHRSPAMLHSASRFVPRGVV